MNFNNLLDLYSLRDRTVLFKHIESTDLLPFANSIEQLRLEIQNRYENDDHLIEVLNLLKKAFFKIAGSLLPYNKVISKDTDDQILSKFIQIKKSYPELFTKVVITIAKTYKQVIEGTNNNLYEYLCNYINSKAEAGLKVAIVSKRAMTIEERLLIQNELKSFLKVSYFTENSFRKDIEIFDEVVYIGNPSYFGEYVKNTFKGKIVTFISYDIFTNSISPNRIFEDIDNKGVHSTIFDNVSFGEPIQKKSNITIEQADLLDTAVSKFLEEQKNTLEVNSQDAVEASIVYLENERFLFAPKDSKVRVYSPNEKGNFIKQLNFKDVEEDDYIVIRNDRDTKLIAEVADHDVLKKSAEKYRLLQSEWKNKLRFNVERKGIRKVSEILLNKYHISTASMASLRSWCNEDSICPTELPKILKALKYDEDKIRDTYETMKKIQLAHRKAGRIISDKLMSELSNDILKELQEKGYYTFMSREFNGASFNIERIVSIDRSRHLIAPYNLMKPMNID
ncbi:hypothetical protein KGF86_01800 [Ornithinibacillus massiliensis]|uniref:DISARM protein DrmE C-terminal domain-containing protein n=1 Tax=Ornithinibacillus massiliensis TaxID=1944633 RepID=A0ABS5M9F0_9BACI|nr:hypothetical protein [Ornithinibacillus massiliensis]MBS3678938.1 hypothetical protein [Ornithinibacillus massiliensis]